MKSMKRKRHHPEQIVKHLRDAEVGKKLGVTEVTYHR